MQRVSAGTAGTVANSSFPVHPEPVPTATAGTPAPERCPTAASGQKPSSRKGSSPSGSAVWPREPVVLSRC